MARAELIEKGLTYLNIEGRLKVSEARCSSEFDHVLVGGSDRVLLCHRNENITYLLNSWERG